jgi:predicted transcriptional regulator
MSDRTWPTREQWAAKAEHYIRTLATPSEWASKQPNTFLTNDELAEADQLVTTIVKASRASITHRTNPLRRSLPDMPTGAALYDWLDQITPGQRADADQLLDLLSCRRDLNSSAKLVAGEYATTDNLLHGWSRVVVAAAKAGAGSADAGRLAELARKLRTGRDNAAEEALNASIAREVARRNSDDGWQEELERRARIDAGPVVTRHAA